MKRERSYLGWLAACAVGAGALVGIAGLAGSGAVPTATRPASSARPACRGAMWTTAQGTRVCLQSAPFAVDPRVQRRLVPGELRRLTPGRVGRPALPAIDGNRVSPPAWGVLERPPVPERLVPGAVGDAMPAMSSFRSGASLLQVDRPCQDENATF